MAIPDILNNISTTIRDLTAGTGLVIIVTITALILLPFILNKLRYHGGNITHAAGQAVKGSAYLTFRGADYFIDKTIDHRQELARIKALTTQTIESKPNQEKTKKVLGECQKIIAKIIEDSKKIKERNEQYQRAAIMAYRNSNSRIKRLARQNNQNIKKINKLLEKIEKQIIQMQNYIITTSTNLPQYNEEQQIQVLQEIEKGAEQVDEIYQETRSIERKIKSNSGRIINLTTKLEETQEEEPNEIAA